MPTTVDEIGAQRRLTAARRRVRILAGGAELTDILRWALIILSVPVLVLLTRHTIRRARALSDRIDEYREAEEERRNKPGPINPYEDLGRVFRPDDDERGRHRW